MNIKLTRSYVALKLQTLGANSLQVAFICQEIPVVPMVIGSILEGRRARSRCAVEQHGRHWLPS